MCVCVLACLCVCVHYSALVVHSKAPKRSRSVVGPGLRLANEFFCKHLELQLHVRVCVCVYVHVCACVCDCALD